MSSAMISSQSHTERARVVRLVAERLGHELIDLDAIARAAASRASATAERLQQALTQPPALFGLANAARRRLASLLLAELSSALLRDRIVFHGPFANLLVRGVAHVVRVQLTADRAQRAQALAQAGGLTAARAEKRLKKEDEGALQIARVLFGAQGSAEDFDLVVDVGAQGPEGAAAAIVEAIGGRQYQPTTYSLRRVQEIELGHRIAAAFAGTDAEISVSVMNGEAQIRVRAPERRKVAIAAEVEALARAQEGIARVEMRIVDDPLETIAASMR